MAEPRGAQLQGKTLFALTSLLILAGCAGSNLLPGEKSKDRNPSERSNPGDGERGPAAFVNEGSGLHLDPELDLRIAESDKLLSEFGVKQNLDEPVEIPLEINNQVAMWIRYFSQRERERTIRYFTRGSAYKRQIERILEQNDVPKELYYLAMIESGFVNNAQSHAEAVGVWQLVPGTAKNYGLQINRFVDERLNWIKSTEAAVTYLKDLKNVFGSWYLALAAYNAGEYRIVQAIMRGKTRDFWTLAEGNMLPEETLNYVPKFMAALIISKNPEKYNIQYQALESWSDFDLVEVPAGVNLKEISRLTAIPMPELTQWNPDILHGKIPNTTKGRFEIYIPRHRYAQFEAKQNAVNSLRRRGNPAQIALDEQQSDFSIYVVRRKDTLSSIARTLGISIRNLKQLNGITHRLHPGQRLRYPNVPAERTNVGNVHIVKKFETLATIAQKHKVSPAQIIEYNRMQTTQVFEGQRLRVPQPSDRRPGSSGRDNIYRVKRGDSWKRISRALGISVKTLRGLNPAAKFHLQPGEEIRIR